MTFTRRRVGGSAAGCAVDMQQSLSSKAPTQAAPADARRRQAAGGSLRACYRAEEAAGPSGPEAEALSGNESWSRCGAGSACAALLKSHGAEALTFPSRARDCPHPGVRTAQGFALPGRPGRPEKPFALFLSGGPKVRPRPP